jgi:hypothetical protein
VTLAVASAGLTKRFGRQVGVDASTGRFRVARCTASSAERVGQDHFFLSAARARFGGRDVTS